MIGNVLGARRGIGFIGQAVGGAASYISAWLLRDDFTTPESAPLALPRTMEPGPGMWTGTDTNSVFSIASGALQVYGTPANGDGLLTGSESRVNGVTLFAYVGAGVAPYIGNANSRLGFVSTNAINGTEQLSLSPWQHQDLYIYGSGGTVRVYGAIATANMPYGAIIVLRSAGGFCISCDVSGTYRLFWVYNAGNAAALYPRYLLSTNTYNMQWSYMRIAQLTTPWDSDYGIATNRVASPSSGETTTMEADAIVEVTWTPASNETLTLLVRRDSDADAIAVVCAESGAANPNTIKTIQLDGATDPVLDSDAQTFSAGTAYRVIVCAYGTTIRTYVNTSDKNVATSVTHNQTSTGVKVSKDGAGTLSNLVVWPSTLSGDAAAALDEVANA